MGRTSTASKRKYNEKSYDRISVTVPKGEKAKIQAFAKQQGQSVNLLIQELLCREMTGFKYEPEKSADE
jgi:predicted HicB family RNase H-like nuclease